MNITALQLAELVKLTRGNNEDTSNELLRYVVYARKSTDEEDRQVRSLPDQIAECRELANKKSLNVVQTPIQEAESAKEPDIRPKFRQMIEDIKSGKYDAIIAWHPDRLARNMKEAGEIIDLLDKKIIKGLEFCSFTFENNTAGKMLLGIAFVLSKQYSDKLSDDVSRGIRRSVEEGKWLNKPKHGYYKDRNNLLRPDGNNFILIKKAWKMRIYENKTYDEIASFLNYNTYSRATSIGGKEHAVFKIDKKKLSEIFRDSFYAGVITYGKNVQAITEIYDFEPVATPDEFFKINKASGLKKAFLQRNRATQPNTVEADLLRDRVICCRCNEPMQAGITNKINKNGLTKYFYYRCDNPECSFHNKSVRAKVIVDFAKLFLQENRFTSKGIYNRYEAEMRHIIEEKDKEFVSQLYTSRQAYLRLEKSFNNTKEYLTVIMADKEMREIYENDLKSKKNDLESLEEKINKLNQKKQQSKKSILTYEKFLELINDLPVRLSQSKSLAEINFILTKIFLNFTVSRDKVLSYQLNSPFKEFVEMGLVTSSRGGQT